MLPLTEKVRSLSNDSSSSLFTNPSSFHQQIEQIFLSSLLQCVSEWVVKAVSHDERRESVEGKGENPSLSSLIEPVWSTIKLKWGREGETCDFQSASLLGSDNLFCRFILNGSSLYITTLQIQLSLVMWYTNSRVYSREWRSFKYYNVDPSQI